MENSFFIVNLAYKFILFKPLREDASLFDFAFLIDVSSYLDNLPMLNLFKVNFDYEKIRF